MTAATLALAGRDWPAGGRAALWVTAAALAAAAHGGAVMAMLARPPAPLPEAAAPAAVMIDLAPEPIAPETPEPQVTPDAMNAPEVDAMLRDQLTPPEPPPSAPPELAPPPETPVPAPPPEPTVLPTADVLPPPDDPVELPAPEVAEPRPLSRPENLRAAEVPDPEPVRRKPPSLSRAAVQTQVQARSAETVAAPATSAGSSGVSPAKWQARLMAHLERKKRYPAAARKRREEGTAHVRFVIDDKGNVRSAQLVRSSGHEALDAEVLALVRRASPVPAPPPGAPREITAPVRFTVR